METSLEKLLEGMKKYNKRYEVSCSLRIYSDGSSIFYKDYYSTDGEVTFKNINEAVTFLNK